jgi:hypothetical protein
MVVWPITTTEAAKRIGVSVPTISILVTGCRIPTRRIGNANCLDEAGYIQLLEAAQPFLDKPRHRKRQHAGAS